MTPVTYQIRLIAQSIPAYFAILGLFSVNLIAFRADRIVKMTPVTYPLLNAPIGVKRMEPEIA